MALNLNEIWTILTSDLNENKDVWWNKIVKRLTDSRRKYHNAEHLESKFKLYLDIKPSIRNPAALEYALFFSYFEYEPKSTDTDVKNIEHFKLFCQDCGIPPDSDVCKDVIKLLGYISTHITDEHKQSGVYGSDDMHYFLDLDMSVLGTDPADYCDYTRRVQEEYDFLPTEVYKSLRVKVLKEFLQIPNIFATKHFREKFESRARLNIQEEINSLEL